MAQQTLRELSERVIKAWSERISEDGNTPAHWDAYHAACSALGKRLSMDASRVDRRTAEEIIAALDAEREAGRSRGFVDAMTELSFGQ